MSSSVFKVMLLSWICWSTVSHASAENGCIQRDSIFECKSIILKRNIPELKDLPASGADALSFIEVTGNLDVDISDYPNLNRVRSLALYKSNITQFQLLNMKQLRSLYLLDCSLPDMHNLEICCQHTEKLYLRNNFGLSISSGIFSQLKSLKKLKIEKQQLNHISRRTFEGLHRLKRLSISNSSVTSIDGDAFSILNHLSELYLQDHRLEYIDINVFRPLEQLRSLTIYCDNLEPLSLDHFRKQKRLVQLGLPLETWRRIDIQQIPSVLPNLNSFTYMGEWKSEVDKEYFEDKFLKLHGLLTERQLNQ